MSTKQTKGKSIIFILLLILAGEAVFILPFVLARIFRPTVLDAFNLTNLQLGVCFSIYGIVALASYSFGGIIADKVHPRKLMAAALISTAAGGLIMATYPSYTVMKILYGYWGFTTIFLLWAAMIKATRIWGGTDMQGRAFGFLDGGRGVVAALFGSLGVFIFSLFVDPEIAETSNELRQEAFSYVILISSAIVAIIGVLVFFFLRFSDEKTPIKTNSKSAIKDVKTVLKIPTIWLLMIIILCAYVGYKTTDVFSLYAKEVMLFNEVDAAETGTFLLYIRPVVGILIGFLADRSKASAYLIFGFILSIIGAALFASGILGPSSEIGFFLSMLIAATGIYAARVLYFAVLKEGKIPLTLTGTAVGIASFVGYTPDIFAGPMMGYLLDASPGEPGQQHVFMVLVAFSVIGLLASLRYYQIVRRSE